MVGIGLGSLLSDAGHEMATAALPGFLRRLGAPAVALGVIEGVADATLSASKVAGGVLADRPGVERRTVTVGYRWLFAISIVPGLLAALAVLLLVREAPRVVRASTERVAGSMRAERSSSGATRSTACWRIDVASLSPNARPRICAGAVAARGESAVRGRSRTQRPPTREPANPGGSVAR